MVLNYDFKTQIHTEYPDDKMQIHTDCPSLSSSVCIFALDRYAAESGSSSGQTNLVLTLLRLKLISTLQNYKTSADSRLNIFVLYLILRVSFSTPAPTGPVVAHSPTRSHSQPLARIPLSPSLTSLAGARPRRRPPPASPAPACVAALFLKLRRLFRSLQQKCRIKVELKGRIFPPPTAGSAPAVVDFWSRGEGRAPIVVVVVVRSSNRSRRRPPPRSRPKPSPTASVGAVSRARLFLLYCC
jgi:hypothetical protein